jgi:xylan 1,4-beta-xylosidase
MTVLSRRRFIAMGLASSASAPLIASADASASTPEAGLDCRKSVAGWARGIENQRKADLGDGHYLNPILAGDFADPTILRDGDTYYMTHSSFDASPGLLIWQSQDLVNWRPVGPALSEPLGTVFAIDLVKHDGRYYIYIPFMRAAWSGDLASFANIYVIHADDIRGPWSDPIDLGIHGLIDPGHMLGEDGRRYLFLSGVSRVRLTDDGLATDGPVEKVYAGWRYPDDWITEAYALEGPKLFRRGDWFYMVSAVGGTAGPPTGHMVIVARSSAIDGPWENCPDNPIVRTVNADEYWWSRGHATMIDTPAGDWYMVYHGYENGYRTLGRQTLLEPLTWTDEGWPEARGGDLSAPLKKPAGTGTALQHGIRHSDDFSVLSIGTRWTFFGAEPCEISRAQIEDGTLILDGKGTGPGDSPPLIQTIGDLAYEASVRMDLDGDCEGGLLLFYNDRLFLGMGYDGERMNTYRGGKSSYWREPAPESRKLHLKIRNEHHIVSFFYSLDGETWTRHGVRSETSGYNANTIDDLQSLKPALFAAGAGQVRFRNFVYRALD